MIEKLVRTLKHSGIYSIGNMATKAVGLILIPLYSKNISIVDFGVLGILETTIQILTQILILGQPQTFLRFHELDEYKSERGSLLFTLGIMLAASGFLFLLVGHFTTPYIVSFFESPQLFHNYIKFSAFIVVFTMLNNLFLSVLRAKEKSILYISGNISKILVMVSLNVYFVAFQGLGVLGVLYAMLAGELVLFASLSLNMLKYVSFKFDSKIAKAALAFGIPLIFTYLAGMILNLGDRYILKYLTSYEQVGLYSLGYKMGGILNMFLIQSFSMGFLPIAYKMYGKDGDKRYFSKVMTYFVFIIVWAGLALSFFGTNLVHTIALNESYWGGAVVIPLIVLAYIISGARTVMATGILLKKKTRVFMWTTVSAALLNVALNFMLIPKWNIIGAAIATVLAFLFLYVLTFYYSNRYYTIPYEHKKLLLLVLVGIALFIIPSLVSAGIWLDAALKIILLCLFPFVLFFLKFYDKIELETVKNFTQKFLKR